MIYLYRSDATDFRYDGKTLPTAYDVNVTHTLNGEYYATGKVPMDHSGDYKQVLEDNILTIHTMDGLQPFRIVEISKRDLYIEFEAWPLFYADMRTKLIPPLSVRQINGQGIMDIFSNALLTPSPFRFFSNITERRNYDTEDDISDENEPTELYNALDVFRDIVTEWGGELLIRGYEVRLNERIGSDTESLLYEKKNITEFVDTTSLKSLVTRVHGRSEWQEDIEVLVPPEDGEENNDNYEPKYKTEKEDHSIITTVDSPLIGAYGGVVFEQQFTNNDLRTKEELEEWLQKKFDIENIDKPQRTIEVGTDLIDGTRVTLGDTLVLKYIKHDVDMRIKVIGYEYDGFANKTKKIILGQPKQSSGSTIGNTIVDLINDAVKEIDKDIVKVQSSANGKNKNFYGTADPNTLDLDAQEGDNYFRDLGDEMQIWIFNGTTWDLVMDTSDTTKNAREIEEKQKLIDEAKERADEAVNEINEAIASAGFSSLAELTDSLGGRTSALDVKIDGITGIVTDYDERISTVEQTAAGLQTTVDSKASQSQVTQLATLVDSKVSNSEFTSQIGQLSNAINLRVTSTELSNAVSGKADKNQLITQINLSPDTALIQSKNILLDGDVTVRGTAWMDGAVLKNLSVDGAKLQDATIGSAKIAYLDVAKISGNITNFIQSYWNQAYSSVSITGDSVGMIHSNAIRYNGYAFELRNNEVRIGVPTYIYDTLDMRANDIVFGRDMSISANTNPGNWLYIKGTSGNIAEFGGSVQIRVPFQTHSTMQVGGNIAMDGNHIYFDSSANMYAPTIDELQINIRGNRRVLYRNADINFYNDLNMRGYTITGQSDERLKRDITDTGYNSLEILKQTRFVGFNWIDEELNAETGRQMGVLAQDTPHLHIYDQENDEWSIDTGKQIMVNSHAIQQLANEKDAEIAELKERLEVLENGS